MPSNPAPSELPPARIGETSSFGSRPVNSGTSAAAGDAPVVLSARGPLTRVPAVPEYAYSGAPPVTPMFPSARVGSPVVDRATLDGLINSIYHQLEAQQEMVDNYSPLEQAWHAQKARGDQLEQELQQLGAAASPFVQYAQQRYNWQHLQHREAAGHVEQYRREIARLAGQTKELEDLQQENSRLHSALHLAKTAGHTDCNG
ncbi:unnamed protein product [Peronospora destructor]|uniref:Uncharacterized protein n=1 Tax=Peronospora destructor TaxID=86335 RepID=A0AAV0TA33_9STRA|nr:unnamed protein product [Peronospora destructor]